jgi:hypothetical protein
MRTQQELVQRKSEFARVEMELELAKFQQVLEGQTDDPRQKRYREWVWCGWYAYQMRLLLKLLTQLFGEVVSVEC